jgi:hypothetical protein
MRGMVEAPVPQFKPNEEVWKFCERLAEEHNTSPLEIFKRMVQIGKCVANVEKNGGVVTAKLHGREVPIEFFNYS